MNISFGLDEQSLCVGTHNLDTYTGEKCLWFRQHLFIVPSMATRGR